MQECSQIQQVLPAGHYESATDVYVRVGKKLGFLMKKKVTEKKYFPVIKKISEKHYFQKVSVSTLKLTLL